MKHLFRFDEALSERLITENQIFYEVQLIRKDRIIIICDNNIVIANIFDIHILRVSYCVFIINHR